jgi:parvulin-like peptidyl-prolyl isomerase
VTKVLQVGDRIITSEEIVPLLMRYQLLPQLLREIVVDEAIAGISCTTEEQALAEELFYQQNQLTSEAAIAAWRSRQNISTEELEHLALRQFKVEKFKQETFGHQLESYFLSRKGQLDRVICSLIRIKDLGIAQELYFRIQEEEQSFGELAREYSQGPEANTGGLHGPVEVGGMHPMLGQILSVSQPGQIWPPTRVEEWVIIVRLEKFVPAQLDQGMRQRLLNELFANWLSSKQSTVVSC